MGHMIVDGEKQKLLARVRRIRGQVEAVERALENDIGCGKVLHLIAGVRGATAGLMVEVVEDHILSHTRSRQEHADSAPPQEGAAEEWVEVLLEVLRTYLR